MRYLVLALDYDGTLATEGRVDPEVMAALERLRASGRAVVLVTGREIQDLLGVFPDIQIFDRVIAENGALLYSPGDRQEKLLGESPSPELIRALRARGVTPLSVGRVIVATCEPHEAIVLQTIRELGLDLQVIFNKGAVMVLPAGVDKGTGLQTALEDLGFSTRDCVGIGDAENDRAFLSLCECSVAVANALPSVRNRADLITRGERGAGVVEVIDRLLADDLANFKCLPA